MSTSLTIYLAKESLSDQYAVFHHGIDISQLTHAEIRVGGDLIGDLFIKPPESSPPGWRDLFQQADDFDLSLLGENSSISAVFLILTDDRLFAITFGNGRHLLRLESFTQDFGLLVALNSIDYNKVKSINKQVFDGLNKVTQEQSGRAADPTEFGLNIEDDLLRAVTGQPRLPHLGSTLYGKDALRLGGLTIALRELPDWLPQLVDQYNKADYLAKFPWVNNIRPVKDPRLIRVLDIALVDSLNSENPGAIWLAAPDIIDWALVTGFTYAVTERKPILYDMHLKSYKEIWKEDKISLRKLHGRRVYSVDLDNYIKDSWPVYKCIHAELSLGNAEYLLTNGAWYKISHDLVETIDLRFHQIPRHEILLPKFGHKKEATEPHYNRLACQDREDLFCMDGNLVRRGGGRSSVEVCDILTLDQNFIHVKRYSGSSDLSHLFAQGSVAGQLFARDQEFRDTVNSLVPAEFRLASSSRLSSGSCDITFAIVSQSRGSLNLPFFSRLNLTNCHSLLRSMGFNVYLNKIEVEDSVKVKRFLRTPKERPRQLPPTSEIEQS